MYSPIVGLQDKTTDIRIENYQLRVAAYTLPTVNFCLKKKERV